MRTLLLTLALTLPALGQIDQGQYGGSYAWLPNEATVGTGLWQPAKLTTDDPARVRTTQAGDTAAIGICIDGCGTSGTAKIVLVGHVRCSFDGSTTSGNYVQISSSLDGRCRDVGANRPTRGKIIGRVLASHAGAGTYELILFGIGTQGAIPTPANSTGLYAKDDGTWAAPGGGSSIPSGLITITLTSCPAGFTEVSSLNGKMLRGTLAANADVGGTGGNATITPSGSVSAPTFTGTSNITTSAVSAGTPAGTNSAPAFTGTPFTSIINHTHPVTSTLTVQGGTTASTSGTHVMTSTATGGSARAVTSGDSIASSSSNPAGGVSSITPAGTVAAPTFTGFALGTHTHTLTPTGTNSAPTFTGDAVDPSPPYVKVIYCSKD